MNYFYGYLVKERTWDLWFWRVIEKAWFGVERKEEKKEFYGVRGCTNSTHKQYYKKENKKIEKRNEINITRRPTCLNA